MATRKKAPQQRTQQLPLSPEEAAAIHASLSDPARTFLPSTLRADADAYNRQHVRNLTQFGTRI